MKLKYIDEGNILHCHGYTGENWADEKKEVLKSDAFNLDDIPAEVQHELTKYGLKKILQDRNSDLKGAEKIDGMRKTFEQLVAGVFIAEREKGEGKTSTRRRKVDPFVAQAVAQLTGQDVLAVTAALEQKSADEIKALASHEKVKEIVDSLRKTASEAALDLSGLGL